MSRSKCARCGKMEHWAREWTNEPDERGRRRQGTVGFVMTLPPQKDEKVCIELAFTVVLPETVDMNTFIGLNITPGCACVDTGAEH